MAHLSLALLGPLQITLAGQSIRAAAYDKVWALLAYLALNAGRAHSRESLAALLWPEQAESAARTNLRQALSRLRQALGDPPAAQPFLLADRETLQFNPSSDCQLDVVQFQALCSACDTHRHRRLETCLPCAQRHEQAVALYRGRFLDQFFLPDSAAFDEWAAPNREMLHQRALAALGHLASYYERRGAYEQARRYTERQLALDPWREEAYRQLMRLLVLTGQRSEALVQYERCRQVLAAELGVEPAPETTAFYERIWADPPEVALSAGYLNLPAANRHNLPLAPTAFVGRETELAALADRLADPACRLLTLVGPGGIGKTRLAVQAAAKQLDAFANGVVFVPLAPLGSADLLVPAIADALDFTLTGRDSPQTQLLDYLSSKEMLLILDNCEHLLAGAGLFADILRRAPDVTMLATSRERLNVPGEWLFDVQGLPVPDHWDTAADQTAVALFVQSVRRQLNNFAPTEAESAAVVRICRLVGGMPLAIELAAGWVRVLSCAEIAREIEHSLGILAGKQPGLPLRHQSLQAVYEHSWNLLTVEERGAFMRLSVFRGGFQREAVEQVAGADLRLLAALIDKSLVGAGPTGRYQLHELARQFAWEKLDQAGAVIDTANRHLVYFVAMGEQAAPELIGPRQATWLDRLELEHDNLRAALAWSQTANRVDLGMRLTVGLWRFWFLRGHMVEAGQWLRRILEQRDAAPALRAAVLAGASFIAEFRGAYAQAGVWAERLPSRQF